MLYDPKWEKTETKATPFSNENFVAWLETRNPDEGYDYMNCKGACLLGQFMTAMGETWDVDTYIPVNNIEIGDTDYGFLAAACPRTFGGALARARAAMAH